MARLLPYLVARDAVRHMSSESRVDRVVSRIVALMVGVVALLILLAAAGFILVIGYIVIKEGLFGR